MTKSFSTYLDAVRIIAALLVMLGHFSYSRFSGEYFNIFHNFLHDAVIIFFVLSGYVIAHVSNTKDLNFSLFWINRFSRLYSVVIPALIITLLSDTIGLGKDKLIYEGKYIGTDPIYRVFMNLAFLQQIWNFDVRPFSNGPFWSLSYEFWYYAIFSAFFYFRGFKRYILSFIFISISGPKIFLLFPIWIAGYYLYKHENKMKSAPLTLTLFFSSFIFYIAYKFYYTSYIPIYDIGASSYFVNDYIVAVIFSINLISAKSIFSAKNYSMFTNYPRISVFIQYLASSTFSMYLYHFPLLLMIASIINIEVKNLSDVLFLLFSTIVVILFLSQYTENKKHLVRNLIVYISKKGFIYFSYIKYECMKLKKETQQ